MKFRRSSKPVRPWWRRATWVAVVTPFAAVTGCAAFFRGPILPPEPLPAAPILDLHCHLAGIGAGNSGCYVSNRLRKSWKLGFYLRSFGVSRQELREYGDVVGGERLAQSLAASRRVGRAVILAMDGAVDASGQLDLARTEFYVPNEFVAAVTAAHTNLLFGASINPYRPDSLARLDWAATHGARLVKWLPSIQLIDPADERLTPFYQRLAALHLPLPLGVTVIAAHAAWPGRHDGQRDVDRLARLMNQYPNLYADISSLTQVNKLGALREVLQRPEFRHRRVYGTDFPLINMPIVSPWFFPLDLRFSQMWRISRIKNPWDRDVALKQALGVPADVFTRAEKLLP